jgi:hypothetical protein
VVQNGPFRFWAGCCKCTLFLDFLKLFLAIDIDASFPMRQFMHHLDTRLVSYRGLKISTLLRACCQPVALQQSLPKLPTSKRVKEGWAAWKRGVQGVRIMVSKIATVPQHCHWLQWQLVYTIHYHNDVTMSIGSK